MDRSSLPGAFPDLPDGPGQESRPELISTVAFSEDVMDVDDPNEVNHHVPKILDATSPQPLRELVNSGPGTSATWPRISQSRTTSSFIDKAPNITQYPRSTATTLLETYSTSSDESARASRNLQPLKELQQPRVSPHKITYSQIPVPRRNVKLSKQARIRAEQRAAAAALRGRDEHLSKCYTEGNTHKTIKKTYVTNPGSAGPVRLFKDSRLRRILRNARKAPLKRTPEHLARSHTHNGLQFRKSILNQQPQCETGHASLLDQSQDEASLSPDFVASFRKRLTIGRSISVDSNEAPIDHEKRLKELLDAPSLGLFQVSKDTETSIERKKQKAAEEARKVAEEKARRELEEQLARTGGLRRPERPLVSAVDAEWTSRAHDTIHAAAATTLARTSEGVELRQHDFSKVVSPTEWLNDEIVNGSLAWLDQAINSAAGIKDVKKHTRKCWATGSFFFTRLREQGVQGTQRTLRRNGVYKTNFLDLDSILIPICELSHWTLLVIRPSKRTIAHMDSMNPRGKEAYIKLAKEWMKNVLEENFIENEWKVVQYEAPLQTNGYDCGVHTITNAICIALGLSPMDSYAPSDMPQQRIRIACVLLNGGFKGDFSLQRY